MVCLKRNLSMHVIYVETGQKTMVCMERNLSMHVAYVETGEKTMVCLELNLSLYVAYVEFHCLQHDRKLRKGKSIRLNEDPKQMGKVGNVQTLPFFFLISYLKSFHINYIRLILHLSC